MSRSSPEDERHPLRRSTLERHAVAGPHEADDGVVSKLGRAILHRVKRRVVVAQLVDHGLQLDVVGRLDLGLELEVRVVTEADLGRHLDRRGELERLAFLGLDHVDVGLGQGHDAALDQRIAVGALEQELDRFVEDGRRPEHSLEHEPGRLAGTEAGHLRPAGQAADGLAHRSIETLGRQLDLEEHGRLGCGRDRDVHRRAIIGAGARLGRRRAQRGGRGRGRTDTPLARHRLLRPARLPFRHSPGDRVQGRAAVRSSAVAQVPVAPGLRVPLLLPVPAFPSPVPAGGSAASSAS